MSMFSEGAVWQYRSPNGKFVDVKFVSKNGPNMTGRKEDGTEVTDHRRFFRPVRPAPRPTRQENDQ